LLPEKLDLPFPTDWTRRNFGSRLLGVFIWKEFKGIKGTTGLLTTMFILFFIGIGMIIYAGI